MEIQGLPLINVNVNKPERTPSQTESARKPALSERTAEASTEQSPRTTEVLISVSNTVADSNGIDLSGSRLSFSLDEDTGDTVINVVDNKTGETIRQIPPEEILSLKKKMGKMQGLLLDTRG